MDGCLTGVGGVFRNEVYQAKIPQEFCDMHIAPLEMLNILVALKNLGQFDIALKISHVQGKINTVADLLSRWVNSPWQTEKLTQLVPNFSWVKVPQSHFYLDIEI